MGNAVARGAGEDTVTTNHPCDSETTTDGASDDVCVNGIGIHRQGDANATHEYEVDGECVDHTTNITLGSTSVFANGMGVARVGDSYDGGEVVTSGSEDVCAGG